jgi:hypothetical protein
VGRTGADACAHIGIARFCGIPGYIMYNEVQLSLIHTQLKAGIANQRHPLSLAANLLSTIQRSEKEQQWQKQEQ